MTEFASSPFSRVSRVDMGGALSWSVIAGVGLQDFEMVFNGLCPPQNANITYPPFPAEPNTSYRMVIHTGFSGSSSGQLDDLSKFDAVRLTGLVSGAVYQISPGTSFLFCSTPTQFFSATRYSWLPFESRGEHDFVEYSQMSSTWAFNNVGFERTAFQIQLVNTSTDLGFVDDEAVDVTFL